MATRGTMLHGSDAYSYMNDFSPVKYGMRSEETLKNNMLTSGMEHKEIVHAQDIFLKI